MPPASRCRPVGPERVGFLLGLHCADVLRVRRAGAGYCAQYRTHLGHRRATQPGRPGPLDAMRDTMTACSTHAMTAIRTVCRQGVVGSNPNRLHQRPHPSHRPPDRCSPRLDGGPIGQRATHGATVLARNRRERAHRHRPRPHPAQPRRPPGPHRRPTARLRGRPRSWRQLRSCVLVDDRRPHRVMAHPGHQIPSADSAARRERVPRVSHVVEVQPGESQARDRLRPRRELPEVPPPDRPALRAGEHQRRWIVVDVRRQVLAHGLDDRGQHRHRAPSQHGSISGRGTFASTFGGGLATQRRPGMSKRSTVNSYGSYACSSKRDRRSSPGPTNAPTSRREEIRRFFGDVFSAFPDFAMTVDRIVSDERTAVVQWHATGTFGTRSTTTARRWRAKSACYRGRQQGRPRLACRVQSPHPRCPAAQALAASGQ